MPELTKEQKAQLLLIGFNYIPDKRCYVKLYNSSPGTGIWVYEDGDIWRELDIIQNKVEEFDQDSEVLKQLGILPIKFGGKKG